MIKRKIITTILIFALSGICSAEETWINDPSAVPLSENKEEGRSGERYRILGDFNGDSIQDIALSYETNLFGNGGGEFTLYLGNGKGKYRALGTFWAHPYADSIAIEKWGKEIRLWTYSHGGGGTGGLGYYEITEKGLSDFRSIVIHPGDSGTAMGNAISAAVFGHSDIKFNAEKSTTINSQVEWK